MDSGAPDAGHVIGHVAPSSAQPTPDHVQEPRGYKADAQDFLTDLNIQLFKEDLKKGSSQKSLSAQTSESMHVYIETVVEPLDT